MKPGVRTLNHWRVGRRHVVRASGRGGMCTSVTPWGNDRVRWVRLALDDGTERSYAPSELRIPS